ncbi:VWA domain-containing protein [Candidatus Babeliales bacterium]|nr:VWA domain-containing protein [Candidatus Babeliales bacterium]
MVTTYWHNTHLVGLFIPLFAAIIAGAIYAFKANSQAIKKLAHKKHKTSLFRKSSQFRRIIKFILFAASLSAFFIGFLQPQWGEKEQTITHEGRDILVALDISRSMLAKDISPSRLEFTKLKLRNLLDRLGPERLALVLFSGSAFVQCPFTGDFSAFKMFLDQVDTQSISSGTTAIDQALAKSMELFERCPSRKHKIILLITDGEDFSLNFQSTVKQAQQNNVKVIALGIGTPEGAPVPKIGFNGRQAGHELNEDGSVALSKLNEPLLKEMAKTLGGKYIKTTYNDSDVKHIAAYIEKFEKETIEDRKISRYEDQYPWFMGIAGILYAIQWLI